MTDLPATCVHAIQNRKKFILEVRLCSADRRGDCEKLCETPLSQCDWVGNDKMYACVSNHTVAPQRVYSCMSSTKFSKISVFDDKRK